MTITTLREKLKPQTKISINGKLFTILQHIVWWQAKQNTTYDKYVLVDENGENTFRMFIAADFVGFSTLIHYAFKEPLPKQLEFEGETYIMTQDEFCIVRAAQGEEFYKIGDSEIWWDYASSNNDGTGLSLGRNWETWEREDLATQEIALNTIKIVS